MPTYEIELSDGRKFRVEADGPPSEQDVLSALGAADTPSAPDPRVVAEQNRIENTPTMHGFAGDVLMSGVDEAKGISERALIGMAGSAIIPRLPGIVQKAAGVLGKPWVGGAIGAIEGAKRDGIIGAVTDGLAGATAAKGLGKLSGPDKVARGMSQAGRAASAVELPPLLKALMNGAGYDELAALAQQAKAAKGAASVAPAVRPAARVPNALEAELAAREALNRPINWRTTDVTPITRPGKNILYGEESTPGLLKLLQDAQLAKNAQEQEALMRAIRQRSHITGKSGN